MKETTIQNALIDGAKIVIERGVLSAWIYLDYGDSGHQGFGGFALYFPKDFSHSTNQKNYAGHFIHRIMKIADVESWGNLIGKTVRVKKRGHCDPIEEIGHILKDDWFNPKEEFTKMKGD